MEIIGIEQPQDRNKSIDGLTPREIVAHLDKYIIGQDGAKRAVAIALRNRWRRLRVDEDLRDEITPNNIVMIGPTGVGKTEIARRLAALAGAPFIKVEASKFTEVGYVGRDVESMIRDLVELAIEMVRAEKYEAVREPARRAAENRLLDLLLPPQTQQPPPQQQFGYSTPAAGASDAAGDSVQPHEQEPVQSGRERAREKLRQRLEMGELSERMVELDVPHNKMPMLEVFGQGGMEEMGVSIGNIFGGMMPHDTKRRRVKVPEALHILEQEEAAKLIDMDEVSTEAINRVENSGMVFLDEIDKVAGQEAKGGSGPDVSRGGVQRDLLPVVEGTTVSTKHGMVKTDHILFIAAGAFHVSKPSDLIPELQGRFPIRVELDSLSADEFERILTEPENALTKQFTALLATENVKLVFTKEGIRRISEVADEVNQRTENIGARRLHTVLTVLLEEILFEVPDTRIFTVTVTAEMVDEKLSSIITDEDLSRYVL